VLVTIDDVRQAAKRLEGIVRPTPAALSSQLSERAGRPVYVKPEHLQRTGSFKIRGAYNAIVAGPRTEVVAASAGNHAQGVALAASLCGVRSTVFMPLGASFPKVEATRNYGADVRFAGTSVDDAIAAACAYAKTAGARYIPPFDHPLVIAGQGTIGLELQDEAPEAQAVVVPVGGGGLLAGVAVAAGRAVFGAQAEGAPSMVTALDHGTPLELAGVDTMADGIAVRRVSELTFEHARTLCEGVITVGEEEISQAVLFLLERCKWVVEPAGAAGLAGLLAGKIPGDGPIVVVLSGGNVDPLLLTRLVEHGLTAAGRYLTVRVVLADKPGALATLTAAIGELGLNLLTVEHRRSGAPVGVSEAEVFLTLETRDPSHRDEVVPSLKKMGFRI
jgi:threonine dehydratase